ncbi:MAG: flagellar motor switch protein FliN [Candidatus Eisenbacteria bacterium]|nr:flagellar motor switch protein FliN [Candidatus Latescibacterota bacterium]MBD3302268.1 flagellar motor switch protein FliN [Candidatus Eisenbacteria bacterium]
MNQEEPQAASDAADVSADHLLDDWKEKVGAESAGPLASLMEVSMPLVVEIGRTRMTVEEILRLGVGSVVELDRMTGEPVDVFVGDRKLAEGQVVVVGDNFGIRITRIVGDEKGSPRA